MTGAESSRDAALFLQLVLGLQQSAMISLGKLMNPMTSKIETDLDTARATIDTLVAIETRTRGNLDPDEARVLKHVVAELRLNYVDAVKQAGDAKPEAVEP